MRFAVLILSLIFAFAEASGRPVVVATHTILADITRQVAGDTCEVQCLLEADVDPHSFEPTAADLRQLREAHAVVQNGLGFEIWAGRLLAQSGFKGVTVIAGDHLAYPVKLDAHDGHNHDHGHGDHGDASNLTDPHFWHDPRNVVTVARAIAGTLQTVAPAMKSEIEANLQRYETQLNAAHERALSEFAKISAESRSFATTHDALAYLGNAYQFTIVAIAGSSPDQEPSARELAKIVKRLRAEKVRTVFVEVTANNKLAQTLSRETGAKVVEGLHTDALGPPASGADTYIGMFEANVATLVKALR